MLKILRGEGILPLLFTTDRAEKDARAGRVPKRDLSRLGSRCPRHGKQGQDGLATYKPEGICACPGVDHA